MVQPLMKRRQAFDEAWCVNAGIEGPILKVSEEG
jgi:hypothetical protein